MQLFSDSGKDKIIEVSRDISIGFIGLAAAAGLFYFLGVQPLRTDLIVNGYYHSWPLCSHLWWQWVERGWPVDWGSSCSRPYWVSLLAGMMMRSTPQDHSPPSSPPTQTKSRMLVFAIGLIAVSPIANDLFISVKVKSSSSLVKIKNCSFCTGNWNTAGNNCSCGNFSSDHTGRLLHQLMGTQSRGLLLVSSGLHCLQLDLQTALPAELGGISTGLNTCGDRDYWQHQDSSGTWSWGLLCQICGSVPAFSHCVSRTIYLEILTIILCLIFSLSAQKLLYIYKCGPPSRLWCHWHCASPYESGWLIHTGEGPRSCLFRQLELPSAVLRSCVCMRQAGDLLLTYSLVEEAHSTRFLGQ